MQVNCWELLAVATVAAGSFLRYPISLPYCWNKLIALSLYKPCRVYLYFLFLGYPALWCGLSNSRTQSVGKLKEKLSKLIYNIVVFIIEKS
jgi:hypothetical protein